MELGLGARAVVTGVADPALDEVGAIVGYPQKVCPSVLNDERLELITSDIDALQAPVASDPVVQVDNVISGRQRRERLECLAADGPRRRSLGSLHRRLSSHR